MKVIKTEMDERKVLEDFSLVIDINSDYALIQKGFDVENDAINIVFSKYNINEIKKLLSKSGYFKLNNDFIIGRSNDNWELIGIKDIIYIEGVNNDTFVHLSNKEYKVKNKLYELEEQLRSELFVRISKSYIVSVYKISKIKPHFNGKLILEMTNNAKLEVSRHYVSEFRTVLGM